VSSGSLPNRSHRNDRQRPAVSARTAKAPGKENPSPDLIAAGPDETVIVEVKAGRGPQHNSGVEELARALENRPGWRFEFVALPVPPDRVEVERPEARDIENRIDLSRRLLLEGARDLAVVGLWIPMEQLLRSGLAEFVSDSDKQEFSPIALPKAAYSYRLINRRDLQAIERWAALRNLAVHGSPVPGRVSPRELERFATLLQRLERELRP
jgi:hypothetical protein